MAEIVLEEKQEQIVRTLVGPLFVAAGAGSGKTFTLTQRIMYALTPGSKPRDQWADPDVPEPYLDSIDQVLAITFTDKAAEELRERIRGSLIDAGMAEEAAKVDGAWISTIHGMCSRIIRAHALDLDIDPVFGLADYADDLKRSAVEHVLSRASETGEYGELLDLFELEPPMASKSVRSLVGILIKLLSVAGASVGGRESLERIPARPSHIPLMEAYRQIALAPSYAKSASAQASFEALEDFLASDRGAAALCRCLGACPELKKTGRLGKDEKAAIDEVNRERKRFFAESLIHMCDPAFDQLSRLIDEVADEYERIKVEKSLLDNDDLLIRAYDALSGDPLVQAEFAGKFKMVMVDEFQDTAQQQVELVRLLCSPDGRELCTVGDAQQSIYRFRGADVSVFRAKREEVSGTGSIRSLDVNYRSHADILEYADRIFGGAANPLGRDFLHLVSCGEDKRKNARAMRSPGTSRRQALLVAGGTSGERAQVVAAQIAERFTRLRDEEGFRPGEMVILMRRLTSAEVYADAIRSAGMPCIISGGTSVFGKAPETGVIGALLAFLANPDDGERGMLPLLTSPMFGLGASELLALATCVNEKAGIVDVRRLKGDVLTREEVMPEFGTLPVLDRAREVLSGALGRAGRDPVSAIVRDVVNESGWLYRLEGSGRAQDRAMAANILKALDIVEAESAGRQYAPRLVSCAFDSHIRHIKESPATLNGSDGDAVRIMTVHASKGLEFPVVAVAECDGISMNADAMQVLEEGGKLRWAVRPMRHAVLDQDPVFAKYPVDEDMLQGALPGTAADALAFMGAKNTRLDYDEAARLLYVALTRAREVAILAFSARYGTELKPGHDRSLVGEVLSRILPADAGNSGLPDLASTKLDFPDSKEGDFAFKVLGKVTFAAEATSRVYTEEEFGVALDPADGASVDNEVRPRRFALVRPRAVEVRADEPARSPSRAYSYSSVSRELHAVEEDRHDEADASAAEREAAGDVRAEAGEPRRSWMPKVSATDLGSVVHDACQWLVESGSDSLPSERLDALCRYWGCGKTERPRIERAIGRWIGSQVRAEALAWPCVRAEVPFYSLGKTGLAGRFGAFARGAIDLLCTDPADPSRALLIDYKTGGSPDETPGQLREKHRLQAEVYADVLHKAGYGSVTLKFVRLEQSDPDDPSQPQVVVYEL